MQLMPGTAKLIARQYNISYVPEKLKGDPAYNVKLGPRIWATSSTISGAATF